MQRFLIKSVGNSRKCGRRCRDSMGFKKERGNNEKGEKG